jgi:hypothetical protein
MITELDARNIVDGHKRSGKGLRSILDEDGPIDLVIIMVGTNDLGKGQFPDNIANDVAFLHSVCHECGVPTIAIAPPFGVCQQRASHSAMMRRRMTELLPSYLEEKEGLLCYFDSEELVPYTCSECWSDDIHFTPAGSRMLGQRLAEWLLPVLHSARLEAGVPVDVDDVAMPPASMPPLSPRPTRARSVSPPPSHAYTSLFYEERTRENRSASPETRADWRFHETMMYSRSLSPELRYRKEKQDTTNDRSTKRGDLEEDLQFTRFTSIQAEPGPPSVPQRIVTEAWQDMSYRSGDPIEVWSNSQQVWCAGKIKKVDTFKVTTEFLLPDKTPAKKVLPVRSRELRNAAR